MKRALLVLLAACGPTAKPAVAPPPAPVTPAPEKVATVDFCEGLGAMFQSALGGFAEYADEHHPPLLDGAVDCNYLPADDGESFGEEHPPELACMFAEGYDHAAIAATYLEVANRTAACILGNGATVPDDGRDVYSFSSDSDATKPTIVVEHERNGDAANVIQRVYLTVALAVPDTDDSDDEDDDEDY